MHECPECYQMCDCDGDDLYNDAESEYCECACDLGDAEPDDDHDGT